MFPSRLNSELLLIFFAILTFSNSCAGPSLDRKIEHATELPSELPREIKDRFEIKEYAVKSTPTPEPTPVELTVIPKKAAAKSARKKKKAPLTTALPTEPPFVYPNRRPEKNPMHTGEVETFEITYLGLSAGLFRLEVMPDKLIENRKVYHVRGTAHSSSVFSLFYKINDMVESFFDYDGLFSHRFHILLDETKQERDSIELNDSEKEQTYFWNRWSRKDQGYTETKTFAPIKPFSQDSLSALFYLRSIPLPTGAVVTFPVISEADSWEAVVTVVRREVVDSPLGKVTAIVLKPETKYKGVLKKSGGDSFIWLTDDDRRYVIRMEAKVKIGVVVANLKAVEPGTPE